MDPFTVVASALASTAVKALVKGETPDRDAWASAAGAVISVLLSQQHETNVTLRRIEEKVDRLALQSYEGPLRAGMRFLADAQPEWREWPERKKYLDDARGRFFDAAAVAPDPLSAAIAEWHVAIAWLLSGSLPDSLFALERARDMAFKGLSEAKDDWGRTDYSEIGRRDTAKGWGDARKAWRMIVSLDADEKPKKELLPAIRQEKVPLVQSGLELCAGIQATRQQLGVPSKAAADPHVIPDPAIPSAAYADRSLSPELIVGLWPGRNEILGFTFAVHDVAMKQETGRDRTVQPLLSAKVSLGAPADSQNPYVSVVPAKGETVGFEMMDLSTPDTDLTPAAPSAKGLRVMHEQGLLAAWRNETSRGARVEAPRGQVKRGLVKTKSVENPDFLTFRFWPSALADTAASVLAVGRIGPDPEPQSEPR